MPKAIEFREFRETKKISVREIKHRAAIKNLCNLSSKVLGNAKNKRILL